MVLEDTALDVDSWHSRLRDKTITSFAGYVRAYDIQCACSADGLLNESESRHASALL